MRHEGEAHHGEKQESSQILNLTLLRVHKISSLPNGAAFLL